MDMDDGKRKISLTKPDPADLPSMKDGKELSAQTNSNETRCSEGFTTPRTTPVNDNSALFGDEAGRSVTPSSEKRAAEGGLAAALKNSRAVYDQLVDRKEKMVEKFRQHEKECQHLRDLTCAVVGSRRNVRNAEDSEREREAMRLSDKISACIDKSAKAISDFSDQQEDAEMSLLRANTAILNRLNTPKDSGRVQKRSDSAPLAIAGPRRAMVCSLRNAAQAAISRAIGTGTN